MDVYLFTPSTSTNPVSPTECIRDVGQGAGECLIDLSIRFSVIVVVHFFILTLSYGEFSSLEVPVLSVLCLVHRLSGVEIKHFQSLSYLWFPVSSFTWWSNPSSAAVFRSEPGVGQ